MRNLLKQYIRDLMDDRRDDALSQLAKFFLLILSCIYGFLVKCHHFFYRVNLLKNYKPPVTVISIGNITLGGTGKTPFVIMLARRLARKNKTAVLIRGYGEDEWKMLEERLGQYGIKVFVGRDRIKSANEALRCGIDTLVLDDGFQHRRLGRDLDIVLLDSTNPFGNRFLFPRGILREPLRGLKRADIIVLTKVDKPSPCAEGQGKSKDNSPIMTEEKIERIAPGKAVIKAVHRPERLDDIRKGERFPPAFLNNKTVCLLSAISDPSYFKHTVEQTGARVGLEFTFSDHYLYKEKILKFKPKGKYKYEYFYEQPIVKSEPKEKIADIVLVACNEKSQEFVREVIK